MRAGACHPTCKRREQPSISVRNGECILSVVRNLVKGDAFGGTAVWTATAISQSTYFHVSVLWMVGKRDLHSRVTVKSRGEDQGVKSRDGASIGVEEVGGRLHVAEGRCGSKLEQGSGREWEALQRYF